MTPYQKYQLEWMLAHDKSLDNFISELDLSLLEETSELLDEQGMPAEINLHTTFAEWQFNEGFGGEIWVCENEFNDSVESQPDVHASVIDVNLEMIDAVVNNMTDIDDDIKDSLTLDDYQQIATDAAETTFRNGRVITPLLEIIYRNIENATEAILQQK